MSKAIIRRVVKNDLGDQFARQDSRQLLTANFKSYRVNRCKMIKSFFLFKKKEGWGR